MPVTFQSRWRTLFIIFLAGTQCGQESTSSFERYCSAFKDHLDDGGPGGTIGRARDREISFDSLQQCVEGFDDRTFNRRSFMLLDPCHQRIPTVTRTFQTVHQLNVGAYPGVVVEQAGTKKFRLYLLAPNTEYQYVVTAKFKFASGIPVFPIGASAIFTTSDSPLTPTTYEIGYQSLIDGESVLQVESVDIRTEIPCDKTRLE